MTTQRFWMGTAPTHCDMNVNHKITDTFIDGATTYGPWGFMCPNCHSTYGRGLGTGLGQRYEKQADGRWLKVEG